MSKFLDPIKTFSKYDSVVTLHIDIAKEKQEIHDTEKTPRVTASNGTQNDLLKALAISVRKVILEEIHRNKIFFTLMTQRTDVVR